MAEFDTIIRGGTIADGTGGAPFRGDVAIAGGRISAVGQVSGRAAEEIDAAGRLVTPGFVDIHTHYDGQAIWSQRLAPSSKHGVTTVVMGNCGVGFAPCRRDDHALLIGVMEGVEDIPGVVMAEGLDWSWETFPDYLNALEARPRDIDVGAYLPHSPLRVYAMGQRGADRAMATTEDLARMQSLAREAVEAGALGFASSRQFIHRTSGGDSIPSYEASEAELQAIAGGLKQADRGIIQMVMNAPKVALTDEVGLLRRLAHASGRPVTFTLGVSNAPSDEWRVALDMVGKANHAGAHISAQVFPRPIGLLLGLNLSFNPFTLCPTWQSLAALPLERKVAEMRRPDIRERLLSEKPETAATSPFAAIGRAFDYMFPMSDPPNYEPSPDSAIAARARRDGVAPEAIAYDLLLERDGAAMLYVALGNYQNGSLETVYEMMRHDDTVLGLGDGGAHYGMICDASFPTHLLTHWTRDRKGRRLPLEWAVKALSQTPARTVGLRDRGVLAPGYKADLNIIDYDRLALHAPEVVFDLPAGGRRLDQRAGGFDATMVGGQVTYRNGQPTGALPGRLVRGTQSEPAR